MIFPITLKEGVPWVEYVGLSGGLLESLVEMEIIDSRTGRPRQDYFEMDISPSPALTALTEGYDPLPRFHIGCSIDERPPSIDLSVEYPEEKSMIGVYYAREVLMEIVGRERWFRTPQGNPDLSAVARALSDPFSYTERLSLIRELPYDSGVHGHFRSEKLMTLSLSSFAVSLVHHNVESGIENAAAALYHFMEEAGKNIPRR